MNINKYQIELLSPVGSYESLVAAIEAKADSIYFGVEQLNLRARNCNFSMDDLPKISKICRENNVKSYLTLNTIMYDHDIPVMKKMVDAAIKNKIDAVIASDFAVLNYCKQKNAEMDSAQVIETHISTQVNISNIESVKFFSQFADVIVLARELTLQQIARMVKKIIRKKITGPSGRPVRIEVFAHGALCMAISGKCYLSLHSHNASANRGVCIQNCRRKYVVTDKEDRTELEIDNEYIMSAKDLCTIDFLDKLIATGISILKIEGRNRPADYVFVATRCYREAIDSIAENTYTKEKVSRWKKELSTVMNRGQWEGYYLGKKLGEWSNRHGSHATKQKIYIGKGKNYFEKAKVAEFKLEAGSLKTGDEIFIMGTTTGILQATVKEIRKHVLNSFQHGEEITVREAKKGSTITIPLAQKIRPSDKLYKIVAAE